MYDIAEIIQERLKDAPPDLYYIPNCDVRLLLIEIERLRRELKWRVALGAGGPLKPDQEGS